MFMKCAVGVVNDYWEDTVFVLRLCINKVSDEN